MLLYFFLMCSKNFLNNVLQLWLKPARDPYALSQRDETIGLNQNAWFLCHYELLVLRLSHSLPLKYCHVFRVQGLYLVLCHVSVCLINDKNTLFTGGKLKNGNGILVKLVQLLFLGGVVRAY